MKGGKTSNYQNGGVDPRRGKFSDPGRRTNVDKLKTYRNYTPEEKREQYTYWDKSKPGGRQYSDEPMFPLDENHPDYGTPNWKYLTDPKFRKQQEKRGITYKYDNKGRLVRLNRQGNPVGGTRAQRNERNIVPKGPQEETVRLDKREVKKIPTPDPKLPPRPEKRPIETKVSLDKKEVKKIPTTQDDKLPPKPGKEDGTSFGDAFKAARAEGQREFEYKGKKYHTRRADETQEEYDAKFPTDKTPKSKTAAEATQEGKKSVEERESVEKNPSLVDTKDTDIEDTFKNVDDKVYEGGMLDEVTVTAKKPEADPNKSSYFVDGKQITKEERDKLVEGTESKPKEEFTGKSDPSKSYDSLTKDMSSEDKEKFYPDAEPDKESARDNDSSGKEDKEDKTEDSNTEARRGAIVRANKKNKTMKKGKRKLVKRKYRGGGISEGAADSYENGGKVSKDREKAGRGKGPGPKLGTREFAKSESKIMRDRSKDRERKLPTFRRGEVSIGQFDKEGNKRYNLVGPEPENKDRERRIVRDPKVEKRKMAQPAMEEGGNVKVKLHKDDDKKTIGDTNLTLSGDFGVDAAKKNVANKQNNEKKESTNTNANQQPKKEEKRGNYRGGSDTPQVMRDKNINRNRGNRTNNDSDDSSTDSPTRPARKPRLTREERFDLRQKRKDERLERRLEKKRQKENRRKYRKESRQYRRTMRRKGRQERRESRGMQYTGGRRISPRRWYKNLKDKLGLESIEGRGRLKNYDDFRTSRTQMPVRQYKGGGMLKAEGAADSAYKHGGMLKKPNNKGLKKLPRSVRNKMGYMQDGGKTPTKETGGKNWMQKAKERMSTRFERFKEKGRQKPYTKAQWYNEGYGSFPKSRSKPDYREMRRLEMKKKNSPDKFTEQDQMQLDYAKNMVNRKDKTSYEVYKDYKKKVQDKSQKAYDQKKESFRQEDIKDRENRKKDSEKVKQKTTRTMPMKMKDGGTTPKREFGKYDKNSRFRSVDKFGRKTASKTITDAEINKFLDDKYNRKTGPKASRPSDPRGMSKEMSKYEKDMVKRKSEVSKVKGQKKPTKPQMKKMVRTSAGRTLLRRMGYLGLALSLYDVSKKVAPETKPALKKRAKSGNYNMGRKI